MLHFLNQLCVLCVCTLQLFFTVAVSVLDSFLSGILRSFDIERREDRGQKIEERGR